MSNQNLKMKRRSFLGYGAAATAGLWITTKQGLAASPNEKLNIACIGIGGQGRSNVNGSSSQNIVALCDVDDERAGDAYEKFPKAKKFYDYRRLFDQMSNQIDAVTVSTPDHMHFHTSMAAMDLGKHLYCEKPMAHSVSEIRKMTEMARKKKLATQLGVQRHTHASIHRVVEIVQSGAIGEVREVYSWLGGDRGMPPKPDTFPPVPEHLKWDLWLGEAQARKYSPEYCPYKWRFWWDFGTGETGNWGCHILDIPFWALNLAHPIHVKSWGPPVDDERSPRELYTIYEFPARGNLPPVTHHWYHTTKPIPFLQENHIPQDGNTLFAGSKGFLLCDFSKWKLYPEDKFANFKEPEHTIPDSPGFHQEWIDACKGGKPATCNFDYTGPLAETIILGITAYRAGHEFEWDAKSLTAKGVPSAEQFIYPKYRKGWEV